MAVSFVVHLLAIVYWSVPMPLRHLPPTRLLVKFSLPAPVAAPVEAPVLAPIEAPQPLNVPAVLPPVRHNRVETLQFSPPTRDADVAVHGPLNFSLPPDLVNSEPEPIATNGPFDPDVAKAVAKRQETRARVAAAAARRAQREGVSSKDYERDVAAGHAVKTDSGCFELRHEQSVDPNDEMWWRTACHEAHASAWDQEDQTEAELHPSLRKH